MQDEKYKKHLIELISVIKEQAKLRANNSKEEFGGYAEGLIMGYYSIITLLKHQAFALCLDQKELGLAEISPDADLLGLGRNPD